MLLHQRVYFHPFKCTCHVQIQELIIFAGFQIGEEELFTTLTATRRMLEREGLRPMLLLEDSAKEDFEGVNCDQPNSVVVGLAPSLCDYHHLNDAFKLD